MRFLVVGCGSIGERHIRNLIALRAGEIIACDTNLERLSAIKKSYHIKGYTDFKTALKNDIDAVLVCTPTSLHIPVALVAVKKGCHAFIEKPISHNLDKIDELIKLAKEKNLIVYVGFNMRFNANIVKIKKLLEEKRIGKIISAKVHFGSYLPDRHPWEDYRQGYGAKAALGGGVILDAIHAIDFTQWCLGNIKELFCYAGKISELEIDVEDVADIFLKLETGTVVTIHLDFIQRPPRYYHELIGEKGTIIADLIESIVKVYDIKSKQWQTFPGPKDPNEAYVLELKHLINCIKGLAEPPVNGMLGKRLLEIALASKESAQSGRIVKL